MKRRLLLPSNGAQEEFLSGADNEAVHSLTFGSATQLDVARCPKCDGPMRIRTSARGSYFHCRCVRAGRSKSR